MQVNRQPESRQLTAGSTLCDDLNESVLIDKSILTITHA